MWEKKGGLFRNAGELETKTGRGRFSDGRKYMNINKTAVVISAFEYELVFFLSQLQN